MYRALPHGTDGSTTAEEGTETAAVVTGAGIMPDGVKPGKAPGTAVALCMTVGEAIAVIAGEE